MVCADVLGHYFIWELSAVTSCSLVRRTYASSADRPQARWREIKALVVIRNIVASWVGTSVSDKCIAPIFNAEVSQAG